MIIRLFPLGGSHYSRNGRSLKKLGYVYAIGITTALKIPLSFALCIRGEEHFVRTKASIAMSPREAICRTVSAPAIRLQELIDRARVSPT